MQKKWVINPADEDIQNMDRLFALYPHLRGNRSAAISWLLFEKLANDKTGRFDLPAAYEEEGEDDE